LRDSSAVMSVPRAPAFAAEAAAVRLRDQAHLVRGQVEDQRPRDRHVELRLEASPARERVLERVPLADDTERLERVRAEPVPAERLGDDVVGALNAPSTSPHVNTRCSITLVPRSSKMSGCARIAAIVHRRSTGNGS
jgi:hypothetical protein